MEMDDKNASIVSFDDTIGSDDKALLFVARYLSKYGMPIICLFGIIGNSISVLIFLSKDLRKVSSNIYLTVLSATSAVFLLAAFINWLEFVNIKIVHTEQAWCQCIVFVTYVCSFLTVWVVVFITIENYIVTFHLSKATYFCTVFKARVVVVTLTVIAVFLYMFSLWSTKIGEFMGTKACMSDSDYEELTGIFTYIDTVVTLVLPTTILIILIAAILVKHVVQSQKSKRCPCIQGVRRLSKKEKSLLRITRVLLAISVSYVILSAPFYFNKLKYLILEAIDNLQYVTIRDRLINQIFQIIYHTSFCYNFIFYIIWSMNYRRGLRRLFRIRIRRSCDQETYNTNLMTHPNNSTQTDKTYVHRMTATNL